MDYANEGTIMQQNNTVLRFFDTDKYDSIKHPFLIAAVEYNKDGNPFYYCFQLVSRMDGAMNDVDKVAYEPLIPKENITYNSKRVEQTTYVKCDNIHILSKERMHQCGQYAFLSPNNQETIRSICIRHQFLQDNALAPKDVNTDHFIKTTRNSVSDLRFDQRYRDYQKLLSNPLYKEVLDEKRDLAKERQPIYNRVIREYLGDFMPKENIQDSSLGHSRLH